MKIQRISKWLIFILMGLVITSFWADFLNAEDYYIEKQTKALIDGEPMGEPSILKLWIKGDWVRCLNSSDKDNALIIRMDDDKVYQVNEKEKTVKEMDMKAKFLELDKQIQVSSRKTEKQKKIDQWEVFQVLLTASVKGVSTEMEFWLCDKITLPMETRLRMADYLGQGKILRELKKYKGYPVEIIVHSQIPGKKIIRSTKLTKLKETTLSDSLFKIPSDYKRTDILQKKPSEISPDSDREKDEPSSQSIDIKNKK